MQKNSTSVDDLKDRLAAAEKRASAAEAALVASEAKLRQALEVGEMGYWEWQPANDRVTSSNTFSLLGNLAGDANMHAGAEGFVRIHPDDRERHKAMVQQAGRNAEGWHTEIRVIGRDNKIEWIEERASPTFDAETGECTIVGFSWNITERKRAEATLRENGARHRLLIESWAQAVWEADAEGVVITDSPSWRTYTGQTLEEWLGFGWLGAVHPDDRLYANQQWRQAIASHSLVDAHFRLRAAQGGWRWTNVRAAPVINAAGNVEKWVGMNIDITERKRAEEALSESEARLRGVLDGMIEGFGVIGPNFTILEHNREALRMDGRGWEQIVGRSHWDVFPGTEQSEVGRLLKKAMVDRQPATLEHQYAWQNGRALWLELRVYPMADGALAAFWRDVTERRAASEALRESEERYRALFMSMDEAYAVVDVLKDEAGAWTDFRFVEVNPAFMVHTNMPYPVGRTSTELLNVPNPNWTRLYGEALDSGNTLRTEEHEATLGITFDLNIFTLDRERSRVAVLFTNITQRKMAEEALRESQERLELAIEVGQFASWDWDMRTDSVTWNDRHFLIQGYAVDEVAPSFEAWLARIHPDDRAEALSRIAVAREGGETYRHEFRSLCPDGTVRWCAAQGRFFSDEAGVPYRMIGIMEDSTERQHVVERLAQSERFSRALLEGVPQLVWRAFDGGHWTWASPQWTEYTGQTEVDSRGHGWLAPVHPDDRAGVEAIWAGAIERGEFHADYRLCHTAEGRYRWFQTRATPVRDEGDKIVEWLGTSTDVDDLRQLQERQQILVAELQHRTFNLLGMVRSMADSTVRSSKDLEEFKPKFRDRVDALARVQRLLSRLREDDRVTFDELIFSELEAVGALPADDGRVTLIGPDGVALRSSTVQTFAMAVHELTTNAVKYGALGQAGARLAVEWHVETGDEGEPWLHVHWQESGVAMPPADAAPQGTGQGRTLIERALPYQLQARTTYVMAADGIRCWIALPVSARTKVEMPNAAS